MKKHRTAKEPTTEHVATTLGEAYAVWNGIIEGLAEKYQPLEQEWKASKSEFGWMCLLKQKKKTLLYMTPDKGLVRIAVVLGEKATAIALKSKLPTRIKKLISEARPYAEGRGIRFEVSSLKEVSLVLTLVEIKTSPK